MKKNLLVSLCLGTVFAVAADANASSCQINSGAYAGISAGISHLSGKSIFNQSNTVAVNSHPYNAGKLSANSIAAAVFGGYGMKLGSFWTAAELFYQFDNLKNKDLFSGEDTTTAARLTRSLKSSGAWGGALHLGYVINNSCVAYAIAGAEVRRFKVSFSSASAQNTNAISKNYTSIAFVPGLGVRFSLAKNLSLRTEYKYAMHRSKKMTASALNTVNVGQTDIVTIKHKPQIHSFNVGLVYSF